MATLVDPDFHARLRAISEKYAVTVPDLLGAIAAALAECRSGAWAAAPTLALHRALHAVAGTGGTFGFGVLGGECRRLEHLLRALIDGVAIDVAQGQALGAQVATLLDWAGRDPKAGPAP
ncbi:MAG TPA: Hpt domain-containing protein [Janthinobacterium sp.]|nr:Hpt domain-containing protein [Janthinobacterium sp.]